MRFLSLLFWTFLAGTLSGQITVGGKRFERSFDESGSKGEWVLYEKGAVRNEGNRRWLTKKVFVEWDPAKGSTELRSVAGVVRLENRGKFAVVEFEGDADASIRGAAALKNVAGVRFAEPMLARRWFPFSVPNDPLFAYSPSNAGYQWHLKNTGQNGAQAGVDLNVTGVWDSYRGTGVRIGIVDDGVQVTHPDLVANLDLENDYDFNGDDEDPSPGPDDFHGTACAGVAGARGNNGMGVSGVAPEATIVGLKFLSAPTTDAEDADVMRFKSDIVQIKSNSWGPYDDARGAEGPGPLAKAAIDEVTVTGRGGRGSIFLWAAGNGNYNGDDSNYDGWANSPRVIAVGAINDKGRAAWYSEPGANILISAPSNGGKQGITTTDPVGTAGYNEDGGMVEHPDYSDPDYTNTFGGTSSATPAVAGVVALMLQANPNLTVRDVQEILVRTATRNDPYNGGWVQNGAGFHFHENFGAGLVNAQAATALAASWTAVGELQTRVYTQSALQLPIPDADETGVVRTFSVPLSDNLRLEHVTVRVKVTHPYVGHLEWRLTSPSGVEARLARARYSDDTADLDWTFMSTHFWGERSHGEWKLRVFDRFMDRTGTLDEATMTFYGTQTPEALPLPVLTSSWIVVGREDWELKHQMTASNFATGFATERFFMSSLPEGLSLNPVTGLISGTPTETGLTEGFQYATNLSGTSSEYSNFYILAAQPLLSTAVDQPSVLKIIPFGYGNPFLQTAITHDGVDAIQTAPVDDEEYSGIEFTVNGPARLTFNWKVSSEKNGDYMVFSADGRVRDFISGEVDWKTATADFGPGAHNVDIYYYKDPGTSKGEDKGWVDEVVITPITGVPVIRAEVIRASLGVYFTHALEAENAPSTFAADALPSGLFLHPGTGVFYGSVAIPGAYPVTVHASNSFGTGTATITIQVGSVEQGLAEAIDVPDRMITSDGNQAWVPQQAYTSDGKDAARSGSIEDLQQSTMATQIVGPCKVTFYWGVSSEKDCDIFRFSIDGTEMDAISGEIGWTRKAFLVPSGTHTLTWTYQKDQFVAGGLDAAFLDQFALHLDQDGDGIYSDEEEWFGTSETDPSDFPRTDIEYGPASVQVRFGSVSGKDYRIEYSDDLKKWAALIVTANGSTTSWTDLNVRNKSRRFYRVVIP